MLCQTLTAAVFCSWLSVVRPVLSPSANEIQLHGFEVRGLTLVLQRSLAVCLGLLPICAAEKKIQSELLCLCVLSLNKLYSYALTHPLTLSRKCQMARRHYKLHMSNRWCHRHKTVCDSRLMTHPIIPVQVELHFFHVSDLHNLFFKDVCLIACVRFSFYTKLVLPCSWKVLYWMLWRGFFIMERLLFSFTTAGVTQVCILSHVVASSQTWQMSQLQTQ